MASLTLNIDEHLLRLARIRALEQGTTVNSLVREWLERYATDDRQRTASEKIVEFLAPSGVIMKLAARHAGSPAVNFMITRGDDAGGVHGSATSAAAYPGTRH